MSIEQWAGVAASMVEARWSGVAAALLVGLLAACNQSPDPHQTGGTGGSGGGSGGQGAGNSDYPSEPVAAPYDAYFDPPAAGGKYTDDYAIAGSITPPSWSWGKIELLEGHQAYRAEGYNLRTQKLRYQDTFQDKDYPLQTYFGELNQELVDGFNLHYKDACAGASGKSGAPDCPQRGPTRPEARFVLLQIGPKTAAKACDTTKTPVLLVHGALQNGNAWISPGGDDGKGNAYPGTTQKTGFVQALEAAGTCTYAVTFGNFHGDNFNQATNLANAVRRVKELTGRPKVDLVAWSKGVLAGGSLPLRRRHLEGLGQPLFRGARGRGSEARAGVPEGRARLCRPLRPAPRHRPQLPPPLRRPRHLQHRGERARGRGPGHLGMMSAVQCVTWGFAASPGSVFPNPYAYSVCENRGATWPDYWTRIYTSNITGLDAEGKPQSDKSLKALNTAEGVDAASFDFDKYNIAMWGSIDDTGKYVSPYLGQMQVAYDLRAYYPTPNRQDDPASYDWSTIDTDEHKWRDWMVIKLGYNVVPAVGGSVMDDDAHATCRNTAFDPLGTPCKAQHVSYDAARAEVVQPRLCHLPADGWNRHQGGHGDGREPRRAAQAPWPQPGARRPLCPPRHHRRPRGDPVRVRRHGLPDLRSRTGTACSST